MSGQLPSGFFLQINLTAGTCPACSLLAPEQHLGWGLLSLQNHLSKDIQLPFPPESPALRTQHEGCFFAFPCAASPSLHPVHFWSKHSPPTPQSVPAGRGPCSACSSVIPPLQGARRGDRLCFPAACQLTHDKGELKMLKFFLPTDECTFQALNHHDQPVGASWSPSSLSLR